MQQGVNDVLSGSVFDSLTAEDLHLLMNGSPVVDVEVLKKITSFMDESRECHMTLGACHLADVAHASPFPCVSCVCELPVCGATLSLHVPPVPLMPPSIPPFTDQPAESVSRFKEWFWSVVEKMTNEEKHDLVRQRMPLLVVGGLVGLDRMLGSWKYTSLAKLRTVTSMYIN